MRTLVEENPTKKFLVLSFNKSVVKELSNTFPSNAEIRTTHGFAYNKTKGILKFKQISSDKSLIPVISNKFDVNNEVSWFILRIFLDWCNSDINNITLKSVLELIKNNEQLSFFFKKYSKSEKDKEPILKFSRLLEILVSLNMNLQNNRFRMIHAYYLKYFQLYIKDFVSSMNYDAVLLDE